MFNLDVVWYNSIMPNKGAKLRKRARMLATKKIAEYRAKRRRARKIAKKEANRDV